MFLLAPRLVAVLPSITYAAVRIQSKTTRLSVANPENQKMQRKMQMPKTTQRKNAKKNNFQRCIFWVACFATCDVAFSPLHVFCNFDQLLYFCLRKKKKKKRKNGKNATAPKQMQQKMQKKNATSKHAFSELQFFATCDLAFSWLDFFLSKLATLHFLICLYFESSSNKKHV